MQVQRRGGRERIQHTQRSGAQQQLPDRHSRTVSVSMSPSARASVMGVSLLFAFAATLLLFSGHAQAQQQHQQQTRQQQQQHLTGHHGWAGRTTAQPMQMNQAQADAPLQEQQEQQWQPLPVAQHASDSQWTWEDIQVAQLMQQAQLRFMQLEQLQQQQQQLQQQNELAAASQPDEPQQLQPQQSAPTSDEALRSRGDAEDMLDDFFSPDRSHRRRGRSVPRRGVPVMSEPERDALLRRWKVDKKKEHDKLEEKLPSGEEESEDKKEEAKKEKKMDDDSSGNPPWRVACHQRCEERVMDVVGVGILSVPSDKAEVRATIEARRMVNTTLTGGTLEGERLDALISSVQTEVSLRANNVIRLLTGNGTAAPYVTRLRTSNLGLEPIYEYKEGRQWLAGYRASNSLTFRVDVPHAGSVLDAVVDAGVTRIDGVSYFASPEHIMQARFSAISAAVDDVMDQAMAAVHTLRSASRSMEKRSFQIIRLDLTGVTRPEPPSYAGDGRIESFGNAAPMHARAYVKAEAIQMTASPIEGEEKVVSAEVRMKVRF